MISLVCGIKKRNKKKKPKEIKYQAHRFREQIGGGQRQGMEGGQNRSRVSKVTNF